MAAGLVAGWYDHAGWCGKGLLGSAMMRSACSKLRSPRGRGGAVCVGRGGRSADHTRLNATDLRLSDLAFEFLDRPEETLLKGFRRLEEVVRSRTGLKEHGATLFQRAFVCDTSRLTWGDIDGGEHTGRAQLFSGAFMAFETRLRTVNNPWIQGHFPVSFVQLNQLFLLKAEASVRPDEDVQEKNS